MKIDYTFKIKEKYFNAIIDRTKTFELRHEKIKPNSIVKLQCDNGNYLIFQSGKVDPILKNIDKLEYIPTKWYFEPFTFNNDECCRIFFGENEAIIEISTYLGDYKKIEWYDKFCWDYINEKQTYLILIDKMLEIKYKA